MALYFVLSILASGLALLGLLKLESSGTASSTESPAYAARIVWQNCDPQIYSDTLIKCAQYYPGGNSGAFYMPLAVFVHDGPSRQPDPLVYIGGGPGAGMQTGPDSLQYWAYWLEDAGIQRDLIVFDQRGLKPGKPYWDCDSYNRLNETLLGESLSLEQEYRQTAPVLQDCLQEFDAWLRSPAVGVATGLRSFSSIGGAEELNQMLALLGYQNWNLWGVSYGTRLALVAAQQAPSEVRSLVLDSPYPLTQGKLSEKPAIYAAALQRFWNSCRHNQQLCGEDIADPEALFWRVMDQLAQESQMYSVRLADGSARTMVLNEHRFLSLVLFTLYDERFYPDLLRSLLFLDRPSGDKNVSVEINSLRRLLRFFVGSVLDADFNTMIFYATECNDNPLEAPDVYQEAVASYPKLQEYINLDGDFNLCRSPLFVPEGLLDVTSPPATPTLIVAGELDPATPINWAQSLARQLTQSRLVVVPDAAHALISRGACRAQVLSQFLEEPDTATQLPAC